MPVKKKKRNFRSEYLNYHKLLAQKKKRAARNTARRRMIVAGAVSKGSSKDVHHKNGNPRDNSRKNLAVTPRSKNRSFARTKTARKK